MKTLTKAVKQMLDGLAYAHAGEHLSMKDKDVILSDKLGTINNATSTVFEPAKSRSSRNVRRVALFLGSELPGEVMDYVIQTCSSLGHDLTVLTLQSRSAGEALLTPYQQALEAAGVNMKLVTLTGEPFSGLSRYLRSHPEIAFLACKESGYLGRSYMKGTKRIDALPVPVVVVATHEEAKTMQDGANSSDKNTQVDVA